MSESAKEKPAPQSTWQMMFLLFLAFWLCNRPADPFDQLKTCGGHLHQVGVALEKYRLAVQEHTYPLTLEELYKDKAIPACPSGGKNCYKEGYKPSKDRRSYTLVCKGENHLRAGVPPDYPRIAFGPHEDPAPGEENSSSAQASPSPGAGATPSLEVQSQSPAPPSPASSGTPLATGTPNS